MDKTFKIMLVDDNKDILHTLGEFLLACDFIDNDSHIEKVTDGEIALPLLKESKFDLVITDFMMPNVNGLQMLEVMRTDGQPNQTTPVVFISGYLPKIEATIPTKIIENVQFLDKPLALNHLMRLVKLFLMDRFL